MDTRRPFTAPGDDGDRTADVVTSDLADAARLGRFVDRLADAPTVPDIVRAARDSFVELVGGDALAVLLEPEGARICESSDAVLEGRWLDLGAYPDLARATRGADLVVIGDAVGRTDGGRATRGLVAPGQVAVVLPLVARGQSVGLLLARRAGAPTLTPVVRATARVVGQMAALHIAGRREQPLSQTDTVGRHVTPIWGLSPFAEPRPKRIFVVEDDAALAESLAAVLSEEGYDVTSLARGDETLERARSEPPDLVLLDVRLPDRDGFAVAAGLATDRRTAAVPILFLSGSDDLAARVRRFRDGDTDFLRKPYALGDLLARVEHCLLRAERRARLRQKAHIDELTGLGNLRLFEERLAVEASRILRYGTALSMVVLDVDALKAINDRHGHPTGSAVLRAVGEALGVEVRDTDLAARYGGDEFVALLPHTGLAEGVTFAERVLARLRRLRPCGLRVSVSVGVATYDASVDGSVRRLFERADMAAYRAKRAGGDRVCADP